MSDYTKLRRIIQTEIKYLTGAEKEKLIEMILEV